MQGCGAGVGAGVGGNFGYLESESEHCLPTPIPTPEKWKTSEDPLPLLEVYTEAIHSYVKARPYLTSECENVAFVLERLALSCAELLLCLPLELPENQWKEFQSFIQMAHSKLMEIGSCQLHCLVLLAQENGIWNNPVLCSILSQEPVDQDKDGPNMNKKVYRLFNENLIEMRSRGLVDIRICPLQIVHSSYLKALQTFGEDASQLAIAVYHYFEGWPARVEEYEKIQEDLTLPQKEIPQTFSF
ncbi:UNVERIFIED_CONTAM: hypothetical protein K2H54_066348 [Gekko kuhli]